MSMQRGRVGGKGVRCEQWENEQFVPVDVYKGLLPLTA